MKRNGVAVGFAGLILAGAVGTAVGYGSPPASVAESGPGVHDTVSPQAACNQAKYASCATAFTGSATKSVLRVHHIPHPHLNGRQHRVYRILHPVRSIRRFFWLGW